MLHIENPKKPKNRLPLLSMLIHKMTTLVLFFTKAARISVSISFITNLRFYRNIILRTAFPVLCVQKMHLQAPELSGDLEVEFVEYRYCRYFIIKESNI
jgi:hypothetical protein